MCLEWKSNMATLKPIPKGVALTADLCTVWIKRIGDRIYPRGCNGIRQLGQPIAPSILFPMLNPPYPQGIGHESISQRLRPWDHAIREPNTRIN